MARRFFVLALSIGLASPLLAQQITKKFDYAPVGGVQDLKIELDRVVMNQITFKPGKSLGGPVRQSDASAEVRVDNNGAKDQIVGIAVVVMDGDGNIVAAGSGGTRWGHLGAGERDTSRIAFPFVFRNMDKAKSFLVTLELAENKPEAKAPAS
ncbi:MAG: hypothetical protein ACM3SU_12960 [Acidobacteriota bacterium]